MKPYGECKESRIKIPVISEDSTPIELDAKLSIPCSAESIVIFAHGGGSNMASPRNQMVAGHLLESGFATLLLDLLGPKEKAKDQTTFEYRFNIPLLGRRVLAVIEWVRQDNSTSKLSIGIFGSSTGASAALFAAASKCSDIGAIVSRGGRPDLVRPELMQLVSCPTLFIVGERDKKVLSWTKSAYKELCQMGQKELVVIPGAGHLFEEPGTQDRVIEISLNWFSEFLLR